MTYTGEVKDSVIVLNGGPNIRDGLVVRVQVEEDLTKEGFRRGSAEAILHAVSQVSGSWPAEEIDAAMEGLRQSKWGEAERQLVHRGDEL